MKRWRSLEHTADLALMGEGATREEALSAIVGGLLAQLFAPESVRQVEVKTIEVSGYDDEEAVIALFTEILYLVLVKRWLPASACDLKIGGGAASATLNGEPFDEGRHRFLGEVKAATYHGFDFSRGSDGVWRITAVFDV